MQGSSMFGMTMHPAIQGMVERARQQGDFSINNVTSANQERARQEAALRGKQSGDAERYPEIGFGDASLDDFNQQHIRPSALNPVDERGLERGQAKDTGTQTQGLAPSYNIGMGGMQDVAQPAPVGSQQYNFEQQNRFGTMQPYVSQGDYVTSFSNPASLATSQNPSNYRAVMGSM